MNNSDKLNISVFLIKKAEREEVNPYIAAGLGSVPDVIPGIASLLPALYAGAKTDSFGAGVGDYFGNLAGKTVGGLTGLGVGAVSGAGAGTAVGGPLGGITGTVGALVGGGGGLLGGQMAGGAGASALMAGMHNKKTRRLEAEEAEKALLINKILASLGLGNRHEVMEGIGNTVDKGKDWVKDLVD